MISEYSSQPEAGAGAAGGGVGFDTSGGGGGVAAVSNIDLDVCPCSSHRFDFELFFRPEIRMQCRKANEDISAQL